MYVNSSRVSVDVNGSVIVGQWMSQSEADTTMLTPSEVSLVDTLILPLKQTG